MRDTSVPGVQSCSLPVSEPALRAGAGRGLSGSGRDAARGAPGEAGVVDVRTLVYRGERALTRAQELRAAAKQASGDDLRALIEEVCDLVALALEPTPQPRRGLPVGMVRRSGGHDRA